MSNQFILPYRTGFCNKKPSLEYFSGIFQRRSLKIFLSVPSAPSRGTKSAVCAAAGRAGKVSIPPSPKIHLKNLKNFSLGCLKDIHILCGQRKTSFSRKVFPKHTRGKTASLPLYDKTSVLTLLFPDSATLRRLLFLVKTAAGLNLPNT